MQLFLRMKNRKPELNIVLAIIMVCDAIFTRFML